MFGIFEIFDKKKEPDCEHASKCVHFHRESTNGVARIFVEVHDGAQHTIYISNSGVTPSYLNKSYDEWCRQSLIESYVFASLDSAMDYLRGRQNELAEQLMDAISQKVRA